MVRMVALLTAALMVTIAARAQDDRLDELDFDEVQLEEETVPYFAVGLGPVLNLSFTNMDELNARARRLGLTEDMQSPMVQWGVEVFSAIGFLQNVRVGFTWYNGKSQSSGVIDTSNDLRLTQDYHVSSSTIVADYAFVLAKGLAVIPGVGLGWSYQTLSTFQGIPNRTWTDYDSISTAPDAFSQLERNVLHLLPRLNVEYSFTPFLAIRGQASYMLQFTGGDWKGNRTSTVTGVPDGISVSAFSAQVGLFVGLFN
jgi:hypothetical protein